MMWRKAVRVLLWTAIVCAILLGIGYVFLEPWTIPGDDAQFAVSIEPSLSVGDLVLVSRTTGASDGALVRCVDPDAPARHVVGRVVGQVGDSVEFAKGSMLLNGKVPTSSVACDPSVVHLKNPGTQEDEELSCFLEELGGSLHPSLRSAKSGAATRDSKADVEAGKVYLASDDRWMHLDSRDFGTVAPASCQRIVLRLWSAAGWSDAKKRLTVLF